MGSPEFMIKFKRNNQFLSEILFLHLWNSYPLTQFLQATINFCCLPNFLKKMQFIILLFFLSPCFKCCPNHTWFLWNFWLLYFCWRPPFSQSDALQPCGWLSSWLNSNFNSFIFLFVTRQDRWRDSSILHSCWGHFNGDWNFDFMEIPMDIVQLYSRHQRSRCPR